MNIAKQVFVIHRLELINYTAIPPKTAVPSKDIISSEPFPVYQEPPHPLNGDLKIGKQAVLPAGELTLNVFMLQTVTVPENGGNMEVRVIAVLLTGDFQSTDTTLEAILQEVYPLHFLISAQIVHQRLETPGHMADGFMQVCSLTVWNGQRHMVQRITVRLHIRQITVLTHHLVCLIAVVAELVFTPAGAL